jgi:hypothetical protein
VGKYWSSLVELFHSNFLNADVACLQMKGKLINSKKLRPSLEPESLSAGKEDLRFSWNSKIHYRDQKGASLDRAHTIFLKYCYVCGVWVTNITGSGLYDWIYDISL